jgi:short-chain fatty acids transporter
VIERAGSAFAAFAERWVPSPFVFAIVLTIVTFVLGVTWLRATPLAVLNGWGDGFWTFLSFGMQMCLVLVTGHALAMSGVVSRAVGALADLPRGTRSAAALTGFVSVLVSLVHWGLGLIVGALLARQIGRSAARRGIEIHYPLVVAAAYAGFLAWHGGLSGSAPLTIATEGHFLESEIGVVPVSRTLGSSLNLTMSAMLLVAVPLLAAWMAPRSGGRPAPDSVLRDDDVVDAPDAAPTPAQRWDRSALLAVPVATLGLAYVVIRFASRGFSALDLNLVNFAFLFLGLLVYRSPVAYGRAVAGGAREVSGILLQFPFYAGILGIMKATGLLTRMAELGTLAGAKLFLVSTFLTAGLVNLFVPSGGGQWGIQGPVVVDAALRLGVPVERAVLALAYGDEWTNMLQPFWALALLGVTRLEARDIVGYTALIMLLTGPLYVGALLFL